MPRPRQRKPRNTATQEPQQSAGANTTNGTEATTQGSSTTKERGIKMALSAEQIQALLGATRTKGQYSVYLAKFIESGEAGVCANDEWVDLKDKKPSTLKQGFENAKEKKDAPEGSATVKVVVNDEKVFLINLTAAGVATDETPSDDE